MKRNFPKTPFFISLIFCICSCLVFLYFHGVVNGNNEKSQLMEDEWQTEELKREEIKTLDHSIKIIEAERAQLETHFARSSDIVPFLSTIGELAVQAGTKADITSVDISTDNSGLFVGLNASGTFNNLYKFLTLLENSPYEIDFSRVEFHQETVLNSVSTIVTAPRWNLIVKIKLLSFIP